MNFLEGTRVYLDTNIWIYIAEGHPQLSTSITKLSEVLSGGGVHPVASTLTWGECLIKPIQLNDNDRIAQYNSLFSRTDGLLVIEIERNVIFDASRIRGKCGLHFADAIHLAAARSVNCEVFLTHDHRLKKESIAALVSPLKIQGFE